MEAIVILLSDARGIYIPRDFVEGFHLSQWQGINPEDVEICKNPEHESYWDAWASITDNATFTNDGHTWRLYQDGDLWAVCYELMTEVEKENFGFGD